MRTNHIPRNHVGTLDGRNTVTITAAGIGGQPIIDNVVVADPAAVPEPSTIALLVLGSAGAIAKRFKKSRVV